MREITTIVSDVSDLDFEDDARSDTAVLLTPLSELTRVVFAPGRNPQLFEKDALATTIDCLRKHILTGRYAEAGECAEFLLDGMTIDDEMKIEENKPTLFNGGMVKLIEAQLLQAIHELTVWLRYP
jgi:hypothetical protein